MHCGPFGFECTDHPLMVEGTLFLETFRLTWTCAGTSAVMAGPASSHGKQFSVLGLSGSMMKHPWRKACAISVDFEEIMHISFCRYKVVQTTSLCMTSPVRLVCTLAACASSPRPSGESARPPLLGALASYGQVSAGHKAWWPGWG